MDIDLPEGGRDEVTGLFPYDYGYVPSPYWRPAERSEIPHVKLKPNPFTRCRLTSLILEEHSVHVGAALVPVVDDQDVQRIGPKGEAFRRRSYLSAWLILRRPCTYTSFPAPACQARRCLVLARHGSETDMLLLRLSISDGKGVLYLDEHSDHIHHNTLPHRPSHSRTQTLRTCKQHTYTPQQPSSFLPFPPFPINTSLNNACLTRPTSLH
jgi:hypothetical protein